MIHLFFNPEDLKYLAAHKAITLELIEFEKRRQIETKIKNMIKERPAEQLNALADLFLAPSKDSGDKVAPTIATQVADAVKTNLKQNKRGK